MTYYTRNTIVPSVLALAEEFGVKREDLLAEAGLTRDLAEQVGVLFESEKLFDLLAIAAKLSGRPDFGLEWGVRNVVRVSGPFQLVIANCNNLREVAELANKYQHIQNNALTQIIEQEGHNCGLRMVVFTKGKYCRSTYVEALMVSTLNFWRMLLESDWCPLEVWFEHERQSPLALYRRIFGCPVHFAKGKNTLIAAPIDFERRLTPPDPRMKAAMLKVVHEFAQAVSTDIEIRVATILRPLLSTGQATATKVAEVLKVPPRTLQRQLAERGTTFKKILIGMRLQLVREYSTKAGKSAAELAPILGFSEASAVHRFLREHDIELPLNPRSDRDVPQ